MPTNNSEYAKNYRQRQYAKSSNAERMRRKRAEAKEKGETYSHGGKKPSKFDKEDICAIDTEGADIDGIHRVILLQTVSKTDESQLKDVNGLSSITMIYHLLAQARQNPDRLFVVFGGVYDFTMIIKDLIKNPAHLKAFRAEMAGKPTYERKNKSTNKQPAFSIDISKTERLLISYIPRKQLRLTLLTAIRIPHPEYKNATKRGWIKDTSITIWDVWGFFQGSFLANVSDYLGENYEDYNLIVKGKSARSEFHPSDIPFIISYCRAECKALVEMMVLFFSYVREIDVRLSRYDGAGALAAAIYNRYETVEAMGIVNSDVRRAACYAYAGGRSELMLPGSFSNVHRYDHNSSYVKGISLLPNQSRGSWHHVPGNNWQDYIDKFAIFHVEWEGMQYENDIRIYPFSYRRPNDNIIYPDYGENWVWSPEIKSYANHQHNYPQHKFTCSEIWVFIEDDEQDRPFAFVETLYKQRQAWKQAGIKAQIALKLGLNSLYGKMAQNVGGTNDKPPKYFNLEWAGYVTSYTRAAMYDACMLAPASIIMVATDGIFSLSPLPLPVTKALGDFEYTFYVHGTFSQAGIYWTQEHAVPGDGPPYTIGHFRGYSADYRNGDNPLTEYRVLDQWKNNPREPLRIDARRQFVSFGVAAQSDTAFTTLGQWVERTKELNVYAFSSKRAVHPKDVDIPFGTGIVRTFPFSMKMYLFGKTNRETFHDHAYRLGRMSLERYEAGKRKDKLAAHSLPYIPSFATPDNQLYTSLFEHKDMHRVKTRVDWHELRVLADEVAD